MILHNSVNVAQNLNRRDSHAQIQNGSDFPAKIVDRCGYSAVFLHEENQQYPDRDDGNRLSLSESANQPSLRGPVKGITGSNPDQPFLQPFSTSPGLTEQSGFQSESKKPNWYKIHKIISAMRMRPGRVCNSQFIILSPSEIHPFGSMPRCCSSLRTMRFIHAASDSSPSCCCALSIMSRSSGSSLNWKGGLPRLSFLCVDMLITPDVMCFCVITHYTHKM